MEGKNIPEIADLTKMLKSNDFVSPVFYEMGVPQFSFSGSLTGVVLKPLQ